MRVGYRCECFGAEKALRNIRHTDSAGNSCTDEMQQIVREKKNMHSKHKGIKSRQCAIAIRCNFMICPQRRTRTRTVRAMPLRSIHFHFRFSSISLALPCSCAVSASELFIFRAFQFLRHLFIHGHGCTRGRNGGTRQSAHVEISYDVMVAAAIANNAPSRRVRAATDANGK